MAEFDDPFKSPDATVIRPRPGAGRRTPAESAPLHPTPAAPQAEPLSAGALEAVGLGLGPLVRAASPLFLLAGQLRGTLSGPDVPSLRRHALDEIRRFEDRARGAGVQNETVLAARYALCAAIDEAVMSTPWGAQSEWTQQSLLVALHREAWGGEKFFEMLDRVSRDPKHHIELMEVLYVCLAMGFAGKYHVANGGQSQLLDIQHDLYRRIREHRGAPPPELSPRWQGIQDRRNPLMKYVPWWVVGTAILAIVLATFTAYSVWLRDESEEIGKAIGKLATLQSPRVEGKGLRPHLQNDRLLTVEDARVVLEDAFATGSDQLSGQEAHDALARVCQVLKRDEFAKVPIQVVGHTDSRRAKGGFSGNMELSIRRAQNVAKTLGDCVGDKNRVEAIGRGDIEAIKPDAKSRRVEIKLLGGS